LSAEAGVDSEIRLEVFGDGGGCKVDEVGEKKGVVQAISEDSLLRVQAILKFNLGTE
jgi:hypothetical protein